MELTLNKVFGYCRDFSVAALDMVSNLKKGDGWCTTQNLGHISLLHCVMLLVHFLSPSTDVCWAKCWQIHSLCVYGFTAVNLSPLLLPQFWECSISHLGARKIPCPKKNLGWKILLKVQDSCFCIPGLSYSVRCKIMLVLKFDLPIFFAKGSVLVSKVTPAL